MHVRFWGTRGSIPTPGHRTALYGGNTSCVEVRTRDGTQLILDCGTGIRLLGLDMLRRPDTHRIHLLIGHTHWDHIQGFPFFTPAFVPSTELNIYGSAAFQRSLEESLCGQMQYSYFPVKLQDVTSRIHYTELEEGFFRIGEILVETQYLNHTAPTIGFRISADGATVAYVTDHEPFWHERSECKRDSVQPSRDERSECKRDSAQPSSDERSECKRDSAQPSSDAPGPDFQHPGDQRHVQFLRNADLLIHDAQYTSDEYRSKLGWGHSPAEYVTDVAIAAGVRRLALFHHDPTHDDDAIKHIEDAQRARVNGAGRGLDVFAAAEGMEFEVQGGGWAKTIVDVSALEPRPILGGRVTIVTPHQADVSAIEQVLADDGLVITSAMDGQGAMETAAASSPDLIILNSALPDGDGASFVQSLRDLAQRPDLPVILLTEGRDHTQTLYSGDSGATDYLARPFSPPMLRARVRAWLARTIGATGKSIQFVVAAHAPDLLDEHDEEETSSESLTQILISTPLLAPLGPEQLEQLRARSVEQRFPADHMIIRQDDPGRMVYLIVSGHVRVFESVPDSSVEMFLGELGPGEIFGESGALGERPRSASVVTLEQTHCLAIPASDFLSLLFESKEMSLALLRTLSGRLHDADRLLARHAPDSLTGLPGRRAFHELYRRVTARSRRRGTSVLLLVLDVVHLKDINDRFGYAVGDDVLRTVADSLMESSRTMDLVTRYGGDEFTVLLIDAAVHDADMILSRVHQKLQQLAVYRNLPIPVECRMGYAFNDNPPDGPEELLRTADEDMQCKRSSSAK